MYILVCCVNVFLTMDLNQNLKKYTIKSSLCMTSMHILSFRIKTKRNQIPPCNSLTFLSVPGSSLGDLFPGNQHNNQVTFTSRKALVFSTNPRVY